MSSPDNPQFDPQPRLRRRSADAYSERGGSVCCSEPSAAFPPHRPPVENPVWNGWDVLLIAGLTVVTMVVFQLAVLLGGAFHLVSA